jgi:hypothetical protein
MQILELAERAHELYLKQDAGNMRHLLRFVLTESAMQAGKLTPAYRQPFDILARMSAMAPRRAPTRRRSSKLTVWGPYGDAFRTVLRGMQILDLAL